MTCADLRPIPQAEGPGILGFKTILIGNVLTLMPLVLFFGGLGLVALDCNAFLLQEVKDPGADPQLLSGGWLIAVGVVLAITGALWAFRNTTWLGSVYLRHYARRVLRNRRDALVNPDDPDAVFVELVPRENWRRMMLETATDVGFLQIDEDRREVRFEGGCERLRIPAEAVLECDVEAAAAGFGADSDVCVFFLILDVRLPDEDREFAFAPRGDFGTWGRKVRRRRCQGLCERIEQLL